MKSKTSHSTPYGAKTPVTIIRTKESSTLVQYVEDGVLSRKYVPTVEVVDSMVADEILARGIPYGYTWEDVELKFDMLKFVNELHNSDAWTIDDVLKSPQKLWSALRAALADSLSNILDVARKEKKGVVKNGR
jgi:hypothetical protein